MIEKYNFKPSLTFDKKYGTSVSKTDWVFPNGYTADEVYDKIIYPLINRENKKNWERVDNYIAKLNRSNFDYPKFNSLSEDDLWSVLNGMVSGFNYDDIVYFITKWDYTNPVESNKNKKTQNELVKLGVNERDIRWIVSQKTFLKLKEQLKNKNIRFDGGGDVNKFKELIEGYKLALEVEQDAEKIKHYQDIIDGYEIALELNGNTTNDLIEKLVEDYDENEKPVIAIIDCVGVHEIKIKNFDEKQATDIMNKYLKQYKIQVIKWSSSSCGYAYTKRNKEGYYRIKVPKPTDSDRFGVVMHEIYHCIDSGFTKPSYLAEFKCDKFALDNLKEMNLDTTIWEKRMKWHILSRVAMATNRGHKNINKDVENFYPDVDFKSWYGKKVFVGVRPPKGIGYKNPTYWDYIYIDIN
jgi:hypothetical protein